MQIMHRVSYVTTLWQRYQQWINLFFNQSTKGTITRRSRPLWPIASRYLWSVPIVAVLGVLASIFEGLGISLLLPLSTQILADEKKTDVSGLLVHFYDLADWFGGNRVLSFSALIFCSIVLKGIVQVGNQIFIGWVDGRASHEIRCALFQELLKVGYPFYLNHDPVRLITIVSTDTWRASDSIRTVFSIVANLMALLVFSLLLLSVNWELTLVVAIAVALLRAGNSLILPRTRAMSDRLIQANQMLGRLMLTTVEGIRLIQVFGQTAREEKRLENASEEVRRSIWTANNLSAAVGSGLEIGHAALFIGILIGAYSSGISLPVLGTFLVLLYRTQPVLQSLEHASVQIAANRASVREIEWLLGREGKPPSPQGSITFNGLRDAIVFDRVSFSYPDIKDTAGERVLDEVSFSIRKGRSTALIGQSGSGKTTIINLLCRFLEPTSGRISVDGVDLLSIDPATLRARIGLAGQDVDLIDGSIVENISYGRPDASLEEIVDAAKLADVDTFVRRLPAGYATRVGNRGLVLSGGQRQRIGIARALLRKPEILIFDEATNAVDHVSETTILEILRQSNTTSLVISHRASTAAWCDDGVVVEHGRVVESGELTSLTAYRRMSKSLSKKNDS
jgi:subfamily B ATP-binding cassette protein MsbA